MSTTKTTEEDKELLEIEQKLLAFENEHNRTQELERILKAFKRNPFDVMGIPESTTVNEKAIKLSYRQKSLMIHPDKFHHPKAQEAFTLLAKAQQDLLDKQKLGELLELVEEAQRMVLSKLFPTLYKKSYPLPSALLVKSDHLPPLPTLPTSMKEPERLDFVRTDKAALTHVRHNLKLLLFETEVERRKARKKEYKEDGQQAQEIEAEVKQRKRKHELDKAWDKTRDGRVRSWRDFQKNGAPVKKRK